MIAEKTGSLIATSARFGGMFGGASTEHTEALAGYGETVGVAFQLSDDLLDIASESTQSGKTPGTDLREGVPTLPVLYALASDDSDAASLRLREILAAGPITDDELHAEALGLLRESPALKRARETVRSYAEEARRGSRRCRTAAPRGAGVPLRLHRRPHELTHRALRAGSGRPSSRPGQAGRRVRGTACGRRQHQAGSEIIAAAPSPHRRVAGAGRRRRRGPAVRGSRPRTRRSG